MPEGAIFLRSAPHVLLAGAAVVGLLAASAWWRLGRAKSAEAQQQAHLATSVAFGLASIGYLLGRFLGTF